MKRKGFDPQDTKPFKLSRSKIELFCECPFCFYLDRKLGIAQPSGFPFNLNSAVDHLLKKEFDHYRTNSEPHPLMLKHKVNALPFQHEKLEDWRKNQRGISYLHEETQFLVAGAIDDVWVNPSGELIIVDYKATSKSKDRWKSTNGSSVKTASKFPPPAISFTATARKTSQPLTSP